MRSDHVRLHRDGRIFLLREDIRHLDRILDEFKLIRTQRLDRYQDLLDYRTEKAEQIEHLLTERKNLHLQKKADTDPAVLNELDFQVKTTNQQLRQCRKELKLCDGIQARSIEMAAKLDHIKKEAIMIPVKEKEEFDYDQRR